MRNDVRITFISMLSHKKVVQLQNRHFYLQGEDVILEVVLSTDGVEPLYFITPEDLTYQAKCPKNAKKPNKPTIEQNIDNKSSSRERFVVGPSIC